jgi:hypothetical protein
MCALARNGGGVMTFRSHDSGVAIWVGLTTAAVVAATYLKRRTGKQRAQRVAEQVSGAVRGEEYMDEILEDSFPASDPPAWSPVSGIRSR